MRAYPIRKYPTIICSKCKKEIKKTGNRQKHCNECKKILEKKYFKKYKKDYKEKHREYAKKFYKKNIEKIRKHYQDNKEELLKKIKEWKLKNKDKISEYNKEYRKTKKGKEVYRKCAERRLQRKKTIIHSFTKEEWYKKLLATKGICPKCGEYVSIDKLTLEHIYPVRKAYEDFLKTVIKRVYTIDDVQPLCRKCNH